MHCRYFAPYAYSFCDSRVWNEKDEYVEALKDTATAFGYSLDDVDAMLVDGYTPEEIESLSRLGRSTKDLIELVELFQSKQG